MEVFKGNSSLNIMWKNLYKNKDYNYSKAEVKHNFFLINIHFFVGKKKMLILFGKSRLSARLVANGYTVKAKDADNSTSDSESVCRLKCCKPSLSWNTPTKSHW